MTETKRYAYKYIRNGEYAIYMFDGVERNGRLEADSYTVYTTKEHGSKGTKLFVDQEIVFSVDSAYDTIEEVLEEVEAESTNKLNYFRKEFKL